MNARYDLKIDEAIAQMTLKIDNEICNTWKIKREDVKRALQAQQRIDKANIKMEELLYLASKYSTIYKDNVEVVGIYDRLKELSSILNNKE